MSTSKKLSIIFPAYNDNALLERALQALKEQTCQDFKVIILDDVSPSNYEDTVAPFRNLLDIQILRNEHNLGAMNNIWKSIQFPVDTPYVMSHHTDDFLKSDYIERAISLLDQHSNTSFVLTGPEWIAVETPYRKERIGGDTHVVFDAADFAYNILHFAPYMFGSVIYRASHRVTEWNFDRFNTYCDRFFLGSILSAHNSHGVFLEGCGIFERSHAHDKHDIRSIGITEDHALALLTFYRDLMLKKYPITRVSLVTTNNILYYYSNFTKRSSLLTFLKKTTAVGRPSLFKMTHVRTLGLFAVITLPFSQNLKQKLIRLIKSILRA